MPAKTYPALKIFIQVAYGHCLTLLALHSTSGKNGYAHQTIYNVLEGYDNDNSDDDTVTTITPTQTAAMVDNTMEMVAMVATMTGMLAMTQTAEVFMNVKIAATIN